MNPTLFMLIILIGFLAVVIWRGIQVIPQSQVMVIERLGRYYKALDPGLHIIVPGLDRPRAVDWSYTEYDEKGTLVFRHPTVNKLSLREEIIDFHRQTVITKDNVVTEINAMLFFVIVDPVRAIYAIKNVPLAILSLAQTSLRSEIGKLMLDDIFSSREQINVLLQKVLDESTDKWGVKVNRVELRDINPPEEVRESMEKQMRAERDRRAAVTKAEGAKRASILESEGQYQARLNQAKAEKEFRELQAEAEAYSRIRAAQAEAEAIRRVTEALKESHAEPTQYLIAMRYLESFKEMASGQSKVVYLPYEATSLLGAVGGLKDIFKQKQHPTE